MQRQKVTEQKRATRTPDLTCHEEGTGLPGLVWFRPSVWWHCCVVWAKAPSHSASHESWRCISYEATTSDTHTQLDLFLRPLRLDYVPSDLHLKFSTAPHSQRFCCRWRQSASSPPVRLISPHRSFCTHRPNGTCGYNFECRTQPPAKGTI